MGNTFFQAVGGLPQMGFAGYGRGGVLVNDRGFGSLGATSSSDQDAYDAARAALAQAATRPDLLNAAPPPGGWTSVNPGLQNEVWNLANQLASIDRGELRLSDPGGWAATVASEVRVRTNNVLSYLASSASTPQTAVQSRPDLAAIVQSFYNQYYNRGADAGGLEFFTQQLIDGVSQQQVAAAFVNSAEYQALHPVTTQLPPNTPPVVIQPPVATMPPVVATQPPAQTADDTITLPLLGNVNKKTALLIGAGVAAYFLLGK